MKKYNYNNLKEDEHVVSSLGVLPIKINDDYDFIPKNLFIDFIDDIFIRPIALILYFITKIFLAFKIAVLSNSPVIPIKFVFEKPTGIYKLYKRNKCIHAYILTPIYPNNELETKERIRDLKEKTETMMKEKINENIDIIL